MRFALPATILLAPIIFAAGCGSVGSGPIRCDAGVALCLVPVVVAEPIETGGDVWIDYATECVDLKSDPYHCGACDVACVEIRKDSMGNESTETFQCVNGKCRH